MTVTTDERVEQLERRVRTTEARLHELERERGLAELPQARPAVPPPARRADPEPPPSRFAAPVAATASNPSRAAGPNPAAAPNARSGQAVASNARPSPAAGPNARPSSAAGPNARRSLAAGPNDRPGPAAGPNARPSSAAASNPRPSPAAAPDSGPSLEDLLGGRALAWAGGVAVLAGLALLFALGVSAGWIGEGARCLIGAAACGALLVAGIVLHERAGRTEAARTAVASALAGLFLTIAVASSIYDVLPDTFGLLAAAAVAASGTALAIRWASPVIAALGLVGAGLAPVLAGLATTPAGLGFLAVATAASVAVLVWQRWAWLSACVAVVATPQWLGWLADGQAWGWTLLVLVGFGTLLAVSAVGSALRAPGAPLRALPGVLLAMNALVLGLAGWAAFKGYDGRAGASAWLAALAVAHLAVGLAGRRSARLPGELAVLCLTLGVVLADVAFATLTGGLVQAAGWTLGVVVFAGVARLTREDRREAAAAASGLGLHVGLAILTALPEVDPGTLLAAGLPSATAAAMAAALAGACLLSARLAPSLAAPLNLTGLLAAAGLAALALDGAALTAAWALEAAALCAYGARGQEGAWEAGLAHLGAALTWWLVDQAPPGALAEAGVPLGPVAVGGLALLVAPATVGRLAAAAIVRPSWVRWPRSGSGWPRA